MSETPEFTPLTVDELQEYFPQHTVSSFIEAGGMGAVYSAYHKLTGKHVAIKVLPKELTAIEEFNTQFRSEAKIQSKLNHPNIVEFYSFGETGGMLYIIMEFVNGKSLHYSSHGKAIVEDTALEITIGVLRAVDHAHNSGVLHRDIKPANIFLDQSAFPKLGDFGLARPVDECEAHKVIYGTPGYTAQEVVDQPKTIDKRADIYSVGAILYELLTGNLPAEDKFIPPSKHIVLDPVFDTITLKALAFNPAQRYNSTEEFLKDLDTIKSYHDAGKRTPKDSCGQPVFKSSKENTNSHPTKTQTKGFKAAFKNALKNPFLP